MYTDLYEAKEYLEMRFKTIPLDDELERYIILASDKIEMLDIRDRGKLSAFPLLGQDYIPGNVKIAVILEAYCMYKENEQGKDIVDIYEPKVSSVSIDGISKSFVTSGLEVSKNPIESFISSQAREIMNKYVRKTYEY